MQISPVLIEHIAIISWQETKQKKQRSTLFVYVVVVVTLKRRDCYDSFSVESVIGLE